MGKGYRMERLMFSGGDRTVMPSMAILAAGTLMLFIPGARIAGFVLCLAGIALLYFTPAQPGGTRSLLSTISFFIMPVLTAMTFAMPFIFSYLAGSLLGSQLPPGTKQVRFDGLFMLYIIAGAAVSTAVFAAIVVSVWDFTAGNDRIVLLSAIGIAAAVSALEIFYTPVSVLNRYNLAISTSGNGNVISEAAALPVAYIRYGFAPSVILFAVLMKRSLFARSG